MWCKQHGITPTIFYKASFPIAIVSLVLLLQSILVSKEQWQIITYSILLGISGFILLFSLCLIYPYKKWRQDTDALKPLAELKECQKIELIQNPRAHFDIMVQNIFIYRQKHMLINFTVINGSVFTLYLTWTLKHTICETLGVASMSSMHFPLPNLETDINSIPPGRVDRLTIEQAIPDEFISQLLESIGGGKVIKWKFHLLVTISFDGQSKTEAYNPEWEGIHYRVY